MKFPFINSTMANDTIQDSTTTLRFLEVQWPLLWPFMCMYSCSIKSNPIFLISFRMPKSILHVIIFWCNPLLKNESGANFRMMTRWCHETRGLITLMCDKFVVTGMTSTDWKLQLAKEFGVTTRIPSSRSTKTPSSEDKTTILQNSSLKHSFKQLLLILD